VQKELAGGLAVPLGLRSIHEIDIPRLSAPLEGFSEILGRNQKFRTRESGKMVVALRAQCSSSVARIGSHTT
jgi:hypothetical protein